MAAPVRGWRRAKLRYCRCSSTPARVELSWLPTHSLEWCSRPRAQRLTKLVVARQRAHAADRRPRLSSPVKPDLLAAADVLDEAGEPRLRRPEQLDDPSRPGGCNPTPTPRPSARLPRRSRLGDDERIGKALHVLALSSYALARARLSIAHATRAIAFLARPQTQHRP